MLSMSRPLLPVLLLLSLAACDQGPPLDQPLPGESRPGGQTTTSRLDRAAFAQPAANLSHERRLDFSVGNSFFRNPWVIAPSSTTARDGLGPLFNTTGCQNCHVRDGRGHPAGPDADNAVSMLVRLSLPNSAGYEQVIEHLGVVPEPIYGTQLQDMAVPGIAPEGKVRFDYSYHTLAFKDGTEVELRTPSLNITQLGYGPMHPDTRFSARIAPPMIGLGLLEAIPEAAILANADPDDRNGDGIRGRPNRVWDERQGKTVLGRFGLKAGQPTVEQQNVHAFASDMGLTTRLLPHDDCTAAQVACQQSANGNDPGQDFEVSDNILRLVTFYTRNLAVPARRNVDDPQVRAGRKLFFETGCQACHVPSFTTAANAVEPELANQTIFPWSDLLLHDMGPGLADGRSEFAASGQDWRTPPLWGIGLTAKVSGHTQFLHDGRARTLLEAVLWHGGEAQAARDRVLTFDAGQREALLAFLNSL